jgi:hypothetical protein
VLVVPNLHHPTLYNNFTSDVPFSEFCGTATFADDTAIFASGQTPLLVQDQLQDHLNEISDYCKDWKIYFSRCIKNVPQTEITLNGDGIPWLDAVKYLHSKYFCVLVLRILCAYSVTDFFVITTTFLCGF